MNSRYFFSTKFNEFSHTLPVQTLKVISCQISHKGEKGNRIVDLKYFRGSSQKIQKKSARFADTFSSRAARFARKLERAQGAQFDRRASRSVIIDRRTARFGIFERRASRSDLSGPRASRSVLCSSHTFKFISYNLILRLNTIL